MMLPIVFVFVLPWYTLALNVHRPGSFKSSRLEVMNDDDIDVPTAQPSSSFFQDISTDSPDQDFPSEVYDIDPLPADTAVQWFNPELMTYKFARSSRLVKGRSYARRNAFDQESISSLPTIQDLASPPSVFAEIYWFSFGFRTLILVAAYYAFPPLTGFLVDKIPVDDLDTLTARFAPGISILYSTFVSLTLSILYGRQKSITEAVAVETSLLALLSRNMLNIFRNDPENRLAAARCVMDQIRVLVKESRGRELMKVIYSDPYESIQSLLVGKKEELFNEQRSDALLEYSFGTLQTLIETRSRRLASESNALPPTHFLVLQILTFLILVGYTVSTLPIVAESGAPPNESSAIFAIFCGVYILFYNFSRDLNDPYTGVYQIRRSGPAAHLLAIKWLFVNDPLLKNNVDFERVPIEE